MQFIVRVFPECLSFVSVCVWWLGAGGWGIRMICGCFTAVLDHRLPLIWFTGSDIVWYFSALLG